jgi:hypothetical protein
MASALATRKLGNWIEEYRNFTSGTESPAAFHLWVALGTISAAAQRKISMDAGYFDVHSNMFIILTSPPGKSRKSTALRIGKSLLRGLKDYGQDIHFSTQASSVAALVKQLTAIPNKDHQSLTAFSSELGSLLGSKSIEMTDFLVDIYDCDPDWDKQTMQRGLEKIEFPWLTLLAATTPQWLGDNLSKTAVEGGFVARSVFVYEETRLLVAFPELTEEQKKLKKLLIHDLAIISALKGRMTFSPEAKEFYKDWYENPKRLAGPTRDYRISGYYERKHIHVLKVAMALSLAAKNQLVLDVESIRAAILLLGSIEPGMRKAFSAVGKNPHATVIERIRDQIVDSGRIPYKRLLAANINDVGKDDFDKLLESLVDMGDIDWDGKNLIDARSSAANLNGKSHKHNPEGEPIET